MLAGTHVGCGCRCREARPTHSVSLSSVVDTLRAVSAAVLAQVAHTTDSAPCLRSSALVSLGPPEAHTVPRSLRQGRPGSSKEETRASDREHGVGTAVLATCRHQ